MLSPAFKNTCVTVHSTLSGSLCFKGLNQSNHKIFQCDCLTTCPPLKLSLASLAIKAYRKFMYLQSCLNQNKQLQEPTTVNA